MNKFNKINKNKTLNQMVARQMIDRFKAEDLEDKKLIMAIKYWLNQL